MSGNSSDRTDNLRDEIKTFLQAKGIQSYVFAFSDPDTPNWTWSAGANDLESLGMLRCVESDILTAFTLPPRGY